ncbi:MAG TPA: flavin reductase, partial [Phycisphaerales bacterium]|nr:flavin reductase [Phycisphaerales bacterium]
IIRDSRCFALCQISADDRTLQRRFAQPTPASDDPFITLSTRTTPSGSPIIDQAISFIDCQLVRHVELDADHRIYVGQVTTASLLRPSPPAVYYGPTGLSA